MWHNWFHSNLAKRDTIALCIQSVISKFTWQVCQIVGIKGEIRIGSDPQRVHCLISESLHIFLLWPNLIVFCCLLPVHMVHEVVLSLEVVRPYLLTLPDFQSTPYHAFASGFNRSIKLIYSSFQEEDKFSSQYIMQKTLVQMNNCWPMLPIRDCAGVTSFVVLTQEVMGPGKGFLGDWIGNEIDLHLCGWPLLMPCLWQGGQWHFTSITIP